MADMNHSKYELACGLEYSSMPLDPAEYLWRSCFNAHWPNKVLLNVVIELLRHHYTTLPDEFENEDQEIELIAATLQHYQRLNPADCTEDAVRFHYENFNFPALTHIISELSKYETDEPEHPIYDAYDISVQAILSGELSNKEISDQPFDMSGLITTLRRILEIVRIQQFTTLHGHCPNLSQKLAEGRITWQGYEEAKDSDHRPFEFLLTRARLDVQMEYNATTWEEITYCQKIFNDVGYYGIPVGSPAPFPWTKETRSTFAMTRSRAKSI